MSISREEALFISLERLIMSLNDDRRNEHIQHHNSCLREWRLGCKREIEGNDASALLLTINGKTFSELNNETI